MGFLFESLDLLLEQSVLFGYDRIGYMTRQYFWEHSELETSMEGKVAVVTGANSGLGKATALHLARYGATLYMVCRNEELGQEALEEIREITQNSNVFLEIVDLSLQKEIKQFAQRLQKKESQIDILINNAGVMLSEKHMTEEGFETCFATNVLACFCMIQELTSLLATSNHSRVINITSGGMFLTKLDIEDPLFEKREYRDLQVYAETKRAIVYLTEFWAQRLKPQKTMVVSMHPGWADTKGVRTSMPRFWKLTRTILRTPEQGADTILWLAMNPKLSLENSGGFYFDRKKRSTTRLGSPQNTEDEKIQFWNQCCQWTQHPELQLPSPKTE